jgi:hypothetical protein
MVWDMIFYDWGYRCGWDGGLGMIWTGMGRVARIRTRMYYGMVLTLLIALLDLSKGPSALPWQ